MKKLLFVTMLLLSFNFLMAQTNWVVQKVDDKISVKFPAKPETIEQSGMFAATYESPEKIKYVVNTMDFANFGLDSATLAPMLETQEFSDQIVTGMKTKMEGFEFSDLVTSKWNGNTVYTLDATNKNEKKKVFVKMVFIGSKMYNMVFSFPDGASQDSKETFFNSLQLN